MGSNAIKYRSAEPMLTSTLEDVLNLRLDIYPRWGEGSIFFSKVDRA